MASYDLLQLGDDKIIEGHIRARAHFFTPGEQPNSAAGVGGVIDRRNLLPIDRQGQHAVTAVHANLIRSGIQRDQVRVSPLVISG